MRTRLLTLAGAPGLAVALGLGLAVAVVPALPASAKQISSSQIKSLENELTKTNHLTYEATYTAVNGGQRETVTIAQAPPKSYFNASTGSVINNGKTTYFCSQKSSGGGEQCITENGTSPLLGLEDLFSPTAAVAALTEAKQGLVSRTIARALGVNVSTSSGNYGGQSATCISVSARGKGAGKYCITNKGILAYATTSNNAGSNYFELTKFSSSPSSSLFSTPAGATTVTIPSVPDVSIP
ncbi:MAG TPA: hypothetical protein VHS57_07450 [Acidimicrobiales bacterium]|nr:hypothetical protein [Acidimicrobiales bacterium]